MDFRKILKTMHELDPTKPGEDLQRFTALAESTGISMGAEEERPSPANPTGKEIINEDVEVVSEKAVSKKQQKFMGMVHAAQKGEKPASKEVAKVAKDMKKKDAKDFASTKHKGLPEKKKAKKESVELVDDFGEIVEAKKSAAQKKAQEKFKNMVKGKKADDKDSMDESSAKPDYIDIDKDGDKKEPMKKAVKDAKKGKKKTVKESVEPKSWFVKAVDNRQSILWTMYYGRGLTELLLLKSKKAKSVKYLPLWYTNAMVDVLKCMTSWKRDYRKKKICVPAVIV
jgi:hypothetical protein